MVNYGMLITANVINVWNIMQFITGTFSQIFFFYRIRNTIRRTFSLLR